LPCRNKNTTGRGVPLLVASKKEERRNEAAGTSSLRRNGKERCNQVGTSSLRRSSRHAEMCHRHVLACWGRGVHHPFPCPFVPTGVSGFRGWMVVGPLIMPDPQKEVRVRTKNKFSHLSISDLNVSRHSASKRFFFQSNFCQWCPDWGDQAFSGIIRGPVDSRSPAENPHPWPASGNVRMTEVNLTALMPCLRQVIY